MMLERAWSGRIVAALGVAIGFAALPSGAQDVDGGQRLYKRAECALCHGWAGDGGEGRIADRVAVTNIRESTMTRDQIFFMIRCGKPYAEMPFYERLSYTDERCNGFRAVDLPGAVPPLGNFWLTRDETDKVTDFILGRMVGRGVPNFQDCEDYWGIGDARCAKYPKRPN